MRNFCLVLWSEPLIRRIVPLSEVLYRAEKPKSRYVMCQTEPPHPVEMEEDAPDARRRHANSDREHSHVYVESLGQKSLLAWKSWVQKRWLEDYMDETWEEEYTDAVKRSIHVDPRNWTQEACIRYHRKDPCVEGSRQAWGDPKRAIEGLREAAMGLRSGEIDIKDIKDMAPDVYVRHHSGFDKLHKDKLYKNVRREAPRVYYLYGETRAGKSTWAGDGEHGNPAWRGKSRYYHMPKEKKGAACLFQNYTQQEIAIFDEFSTSTFPNLRFWNRIVDNVPCVVRILYGDVQFNSPIIIFCSNYKLEDLFPNSDNRSTLFGRAKQYITYMKFWKEEEEGQPPRYCKRLLTPDWDTLIQEAKDTENYEMRRAARARAQDGQTRTGTMLDFSRNNPSS